MIPLRLSIQGLYSYQQKQEIDFSRLTQAQIFGIFGATGSGKSSILEAISYALYGQCERLNMRDERAYNMMNLKSNSLFIDFEFLSNEKRYKFTVSGKRNSKQFRKVGSLERKAFIYQNEELVPLESADATHILGLSYDNFKRTVIIPQGKFQEFLQLTETDRTRMLKEIFGLEKYELHQKSVQLERLNQAEITKQETLILQLSSATPEALEALLNQLTELDQEITSVRKVVQQQEKQLQKIQQIQEQLVQLQQERQNLKLLMDRESHMQDREQKLKAYENCLLNFKPLFDRKGELSSQFESIQQEIKSKKEMLVTANKEFERSEETRLRVQDSYESRDQFLKGAEELGKIIELKELLHNIEALKGRITKGDELIGKMKRDIEQMKIELNEKSNEIKKLRENKPDVQTLISLKEWFATYKNLQEEEKQAQNQLLETEKSLTEFQQLKIQLLQQTSLSHTQYDLAGDQISALLQQRKVDVKEQIVQLTDEIASLTAKQKLMEFADQLQSGEACPLCGATDHPNVIVISHKESHIEQKKLSLASSQEQAQQLQDVAMRLEMTFQQVGNSKAEWEKQKKIVQEKELLRTKHEDAFLWKAYSKEDEAKVSETLKKLELHDEEINRLTQQWEALEISINKEEKTQERYQKELDKLKELHHKEEVKYQAIFQNIQLVAVDSHIQLEKNKLEELILDRREQHKSIESLYKTTIDRNRQLASNSDRLKGELSEMDKQAKEFTHRLAQINQQIQQRHEQSHFTSLDEIYSILSHQIDIEAEKQALEQYKKEIHTTQQLILQIEQKVAGQEQEIQQIHDLQNAIEQSNERLQALTLTKGGLDTQKAQLEKDLQTKVQLQLKLDKLKLRGENIKTLKLLFQRSGFVNYVSTIYLKNLCLAANERFMKLTRGSLSLEPTIQNNFQIRDFLNDGKVRSVKTLSGGQTFQASLSLALSLADQVHKEAKREQNFFFLDEGFGSQDKQSLQTIFQTLTSLRKENRIVGVISHVEELRQEIDTYLQIANDEEKGSIVRTSWT